MLFFTSRDWIGGIDTVNGQRGKGCIHRIWRQWQNGESALRPAERNQPIAQGCRDLLSNHEMSLVYHWLVEWRFTYATFLEFLDRGCPKLIINVHLVIPVKVRNDTKLLIFFWAMSLLFGRCNRLLFMRRANTKPSFFVAEQDLNNKWLR